MGLGGTAISVEGAFLVRFVRPLVGVQQRQRFRGQLCPELCDQLRQQRREQLRLPGGVVRGVRLLLGKSFANLWDKVSWTLFRCDDKASVS